MLSSSSSADSSSPPTDSPPYVALRTHLHNLLPKHVLFHVRLQIHVLSSVPLVSGHFAVRWKLKNTHSVPGSGRKQQQALLKKVRRPPSRQSSNGPSMTDSLFHTDDTEDTSGVSVDSHSSSTSGENPDGPPSTVHLSASTLESKPLTSSSRSSSCSAMALSPWPKDAPNSNSYLGFSPALRATPSQTSESLAATTSEYSTQTRGMTEFQPLKEHSVVWEHTVNSVVKMDVQRDSRDLLPFYLKLVVMQQVVSGDVDAPQNPRFGSLHLNLAEYAGDPSQQSDNTVSNVTRRYLLAESKTNATLKLTLQLERIGGETDFVPPPLPKGEIFAGVSGLLDKDIYKVRPTAFDFFASQTFEDQDGKRTARRNTAKSGHPTSIPLPERLPLASGPQTTEALIEALFNPVLVTDESKVTPFTVYSSTPRPSSLSRDTTYTPRGLERSNTQASDPATLSSAASTYSVDTESSHSTMESHSTTSSTSSKNRNLLAVPRSVSDPITTPTGGFKGLWMRKVGSRPSTPSSPVHS